MSEHLWMYEGLPNILLTYFQINQGLIDETNSLKMAGKIAQSRQMNDNMSLPKNE